MSITFLNTSRIPWSYFPNAGDSLLPPDGCISPFPTGKWILENILFSARYGEPPSTITAISCILGASPGNRIQKAGLTIERAYTTNLRRV